MSFLSLPDEIINNIAFHIIALSPLGPPHALLTLALTSRQFNSVVTSNSFKAKICRLMFDIRPITRRLFTPRDTDLADELHRCCNILKQIRAADIQETDSATNIIDTLNSAYYLMLSNDGKNYAQLEHAGLHAYLHAFVKTRLWEGRESNQGWPLDNTDNSTVLWLMWMTLTKQKLLAETLADREEMVLLTLPYVVLPHRYASASAPPNHFNLPLDSQNPHHQQPLINTLSPETPYPIYITPNPLLMLYFNARISVCPPLITIAAKLLFVARKELSPIRAPPHLPQAPGPGITGITQEDYREINRSPGARLCRVVTWDWNTGSPKRVGGEQGDGGDIEDEGWEESKVWDTEWWRRLLCIYRDSPRPKYLPGDIFKIGSMKGSWHGKEYLPQGNLFVHFLRHPNVHYPGIPDPRRPHLFTEASIGLSMKPVFLDIQEHHKICECAHSTTTLSHPYVPATLPNADVPATTRPLPIVSQSGRCGIVPVPAPLVFTSNENNEDGQDGEEASDALVMSLATPNISVIDYSMSNAWFPGHLGGVAFTKLPSFGGRGRREKMVCAVNFQQADVRGVLSRPEESECLALGGRVRQQEGRMNAYVYETYDEERMSVHRGLGVAGAELDNQCPRCVQREVLIRDERRKAERSSRMMLDRGMREYGRSGGFDWNQDEDMSEDDDEEEEEDEEMRDVDVSEMGIDVEGIIMQHHLRQQRRQTSSSMNVDEEEDDESSSSSSAAASSGGVMTSYGDDEVEEPVEPAERYTYQRKRKCFDKSRIGVECSGVADVLLSGETGPRHAIWQQYTMYGRVRPWDGLIGILRSANANNNTNNIFIFGYLVGENNFVGEWRVAASDPLSPTWSGPIVMSRRAPAAVPVPAVPAAV